MPSIRRRSGEAVDHGLDLLPGSGQDDRIQPETTVIVNSAASGIVSPVGDLPQDLLSAPVGMDDDLSHALLARPPRRKLPGVTAFLTAAVLIAGGFLGGVITQKHEGPSSSAGGSTAALAAAFRNRGATGTGTGAAGTTAAPGGTGAAAGAGGGGGAGTGTGTGTTIGTVKLVDGNKIYLTATDGSTIVVTTGTGTTIKVQKNGVPSDLAPGTTIVVQGAAGADGVVKATTVTEGGTGGGGFGGFGGGGRNRTGAGAGTGTGGTGGAAPTGGNAGG
jgi:hypothetical protein